MTRLPKNSSSKLYWSSEQITLVYIQQCQIYWTGADICVCVCVCTFGSWDLVFWTGFLILLLLFVYIWAKCITNYTLPVLRFVLLLLLPPSDYHLFFKCFRYNAYTLYPIDIWAMTIKKKKNTNNNNSDKINMNRIGATNKIESVTEKMIKNDGKRD